MGVYGYDTNSDARQRVSTELEVTVFDNMDDVWDAEPHGVIIATPNHLHLESTQQVFLQWQQRGLLSIRGVLVEKPLAIDLKSAQELLRATLVDGLVSIRVLVGYNLRFHPGLRKVKELLDNGAVGSPLCASIYCGSYLPDWRPGTDYRSNYAARRDSGGGVLLDISHELDYACWLFGEPAAVTCMAQTTGALEGLQTEDVADVLIRFKSGVQANVHLDYVRRDRKRGCEIVGTEGTLVWDAASDLIYRCVSEPLNKYQWFVGPVDGDTMYRQQLRHFINVVRGDEQPLCTGQDGLRALQLALAARESSETGRTVTL